MAFTYDATLATDLSNVRFYTGDTQENAGPRPDKRNFTDAEVGFALTAEDDRINGAVAHLFEVLANEWISYSLSEKEGDRDFDAKELYDYYNQQAAFWRKKPGGEALTGLPDAIVDLDRTDAYS